MIDVDKNSLSLYKMVKKNIESVYIRMLSTQVKDYSLLW